MHASHAPSATVGAAVGTGAVYPCPKPEQLPCSLESKHRSLLGDCPQHGLPAKKCNEMCGVKTRLRYESHATQEVNTPHPSNQTPEACSSKCWETGRNRTREEELTGPILDVDDKVFVYALVWFMYLASVGVRASVSC